jgi:hypothetical protein
MARLARFAARRRTELEGARDRARDAGYEDPRGTFGSNGQEMIGEVIGGILRGVLQGGTLDRVLRDNYRYPRRRADPDFNWGEHCHGLGRGAEATPTLGQAAVATVAGGARVAFS